MVEKGYIDREVAFDKITDLAGMATTKAAYVAIWKSAKELNKIPNADVVEVVRCKDCIYRGREDCAMFYRCNCGEQHTWETDNDFCSYGERKGD